MEVVALKASMLGHMAVLVLSPRMQLEVGVPKKVIHAGAHHRMHDIQLGMGDLEAVGRDDPGNSKLSAVKVT